MPNFIIMNLYLAVPKIPAAKNICDFAVRQGCLSLVGKILFKNMTPVLIRICPMRLLTSELIHWVKLIS